jgi:hypothetical protein
MLNFLDLFVLRLILFVTYMLRKFVCPCPIFLAPIKAPPATVLYFRTSKNIAAVSASKTPKSGAIKQQTRSTK